jgi:hypothetical protein
MQFLRRLPGRIWRLFVDDGSIGALLLAWIACACLVLPHLRIGAWSGPMLFAGIAAITLYSLKPRR